MVFSFIYEPLIAGLIAIKITLTQIQLTHSSFVFSYFFKFVALAHLMYLFSFAKSYSSFSIFLLSRSFCHFSFAIGNNIYSLHAHSNYFRSDTLNQTFSFLVFFFFLLFFISSAVNGRLHLAWCVFF